MKKSLTFKVFGFALIALVMTACSKYEEGSKFTLLTKKARMTNTWTMTSRTVDGIEDASLIMTTTTWELSKDGTAKVSTNVGGTQAEEGTWKFSHNKSKLEVDIFANHDIWDIIQLKNKSLKLYKFFGNPAGGGQAVAMTFEVE